MKYEMVFGDETLFGGAPEDCILVVRPEDDDSIFYLENNKSELRGCVAARVDGVVKLAMRRIIKEPKRWTWEDKKAGRLPEVGCSVSSVAHGYVCSVVAIDSNSRHIWCQFPDQSVGSCMIFEIKPIETPTEKAQREEDEFVNSVYMLVGVCTVSDEINKAHKAGIRAAYRKLKGG